MTLERRIASTAIVLFAVQLSLADNGKTPDGLKSAIKCVEQALALSDQALSKKCISYDALREAWEPRLWQWVGRPGPPTETEIEQDIDLLHQSQLIGLMLEGDFSTLEGVRRVLHGGVAAGQAQDRNIFEHASLVKLSADRAMFLLVGDNAEPVRPVFGERDGMWMLVDIQLERPEIP